MAIFNNRNNSNKKYNQARKGACFSVTMPYHVESRLKEIQKSMGLNSKSQTIVFLIHHYDKERRAFDSIDKLNSMLDKMLKFESDQEKESITKVKVKSDDVVEQQTLPYNNNN